MRKCHVCDIEFDDVTVQCVHCGRWLELSAAAQRIFTQADRAKSSVSSTDAGPDMCDEGGICIDDD